MGSRSRKRRRTSEERAEEARAALVPLAPGERPLAVTIGAVIALIIGAANLILLATGYEVRGSENATDKQRAMNDFQAVAISVVMLVMAVFMWRGRYWAVLGFQALLALTVIFAGMALLVASNLQAVALSLTVMVAGGTLFWFLVKALARLQMPQRPAPRPR